MNREYAEKVLMKYGRPVIKTGKGSISFARHDMGSVERIEAMSNEDLLKEYKNMVWMNYIYGQVSVGDLQGIDLMDLEIDERKIGEGLEEWYKEAVKQFDKQEQL